MLFFPIFSGRAEEKWWNNARPEILMKFEPCSKFFLWFSLIFSLLLLFSRFQAPSNYNSVCKGDEEKFVDNFSWYDIKVTMKNMKFDTQYCSSIPIPVEESLGTWKTKEGLQCENKLLRKMCLLQSTCLEFFSKFYSSVSIFSSWTSLITLSGFAKKSKPLLCRPGQVSEIHVIFSNKFSKLCKQTRIQRISLTYIAFPRIQICLLFAWQYIWSDAR